MELVENGFSGVTFSRRTDVKYGMRPMPYYEIDGDLELLTEIKNQLFMHGINATLSETKYFNALQINGIQNCLTLCELIGIKDGWHDSLRSDFIKGSHLTPAGIKHLYVQFGKKTKLSYEELCDIIDEAQSQRLNTILMKIYDQKKKLTMLPPYDPLYDQFDLQTIPCTKCGNHGDILIYFYGKYPKPSNLFFLCNNCATQFIL